MFFNGLPHLDFQGSLCGLGDSIDRSILYGIFRKNLNPKLFGDPFPDDKLNIVLDKVLSQYRLIVDKDKQLPETVSNQVRSGVLGIIDSVVGSDTRKYWSANILLAVNDLDSQNYALVPKDYGISTTPKQLQTPINTSSGSSFLDRFSSAVTSAINTVTETPQSGNVSAGGQIQQGPAQPTGGGVKRQSDNPIIYQTRTKKLSAVEKTRLMWILGLGGVVFVVTLGIVASRD